MTAVTPSFVPFAEVLASLMPGGRFDGTVARGAFDAILAGAWTRSQVAAFASVLRVRGEDPETIAAGVLALRETMIAVEHGLPLVVDTCGTGGDGRETLNLSTASAIVVAALGVPVAKHGNRSVSSACGSADVLEAMGIPTDVPTDAHASILRDVGITFLFAPRHHGALRHAAEARRELGVRTIFNALGPLANPARATHQLVGVYEDRLRPIAARALGEVGVARAWVVRSAEGLDEVSPTFPTFVTELASGTIRERVVEPKDFGFAPSPENALRGGRPEENARALLAILRAEGHPATDAVLLGAAAAFAVAKDVPLLEAGERARAVLASGEALATFERWRDRVAAWSAPA